MGYTTDLTDTQWELIEEFFVVKKGKNLQQHNKRDLVNAVLYRNKTGCQWRLLPKDFPPHDTVWSFYRRAVKKGVWEKAMDKMVKKVRVDAGRAPEPSYGLNGRMLPCLNFDTPCTFPLETGMKASWDHLLELCMEIPACPECQSCKDADYCMNCPGYLQTETGKFDKSAPYLCDLAKVRKQLFQR